MPVDPSSLSESHVFCREFYYNACFLYLSFIIKTHTHIFSKKRILQQILKSGFMTQIMQYNVHISGPILQCQSIDCQTFQ